MKITTLKQLGAFIRDQRRQRHWTQQELADASGTLQSWLSGVERGKGNPEFGKLMAVLRTLNITLDLLPQAAGTKHRSQVKDGTSVPARIKVPRLGGREQPSQPEDGAGAATSNTRSSPSAQSPSVQALRARFQKGDQK